MATRNTEGLADRVYRDLLDQIIQGNLKEGDKLATEQALSEQFGTSRPTVREALSRLRADGIVTSRQGAGTFVTRRPDPDLPRFMPLDSLSDVRRVLEFRTFLESGAAALAAEMAEAQDLENIQAALARLNTAVASKTLGSEEDFAFHMAIAHASKNPFFISVIGSIQEHMRFGMQLMRSFTLARSEERLKRVQEEHTEVVRAILARDPRAAEQAMRHHLESTRRRLLGS